jgi:hypothetical protein
MSAKPNKPAAVQMTRVKSSNVEQIGYEAETKTLHVIFQGGGHYTYHKVDPKLYEQLTKAPSIGAFLHQNIKGRHETKKIS